MEGPGFELRQPGPRACATVHALGSEVSAKDLISKASDGEGERVLLAFKVLVIECHIQNCIYHNMSFFGLLTERFSGKGRKERRKERRKMKKERKKGKGREDRRKNFSKIIGWPLGYEEKKKKNLLTFLLHCFQEQQKARL